MLKLSLCKAFYLMLTGAVCRLNTDEKEEKKTKKDILLRAINEYAFARKNPIRGQRRVVRRN